MSSISQAEQRRWGASTTTQEERQYLIFQVGDKKYAMDILCIKEIVRYTGVTELPTTPEFIRGVINLHGSMATIIDLGVRFGRPPAASTQRTSVLIVESTVDDQAQTIGLMVDNVDEVVDIPAGDIEPPPALGHAICLDFIAGIAKIDHNVIIILDGRQILSRNEMATLEALTEHALDMPEVEPEAQD